MKLTLFPNSNWRLQIGFSCILILSVFALYVASIHFPLIFDSLMMNESNFESYKHGLDPSLPRWLSYWTLGSVHANFRNPAPIHNALNLVIHIANVLTLFYFFQLLWNCFITSLDSKPYQRQILTVASFFAALLFGLNPVGIYATAYTMQRSMLMTTFFSLWSLIAWLKGVTSDKLKYIYLTVLLYFLALASKEHSILIFGIYMLLGYKFVEPAHYKKYIIPLIACLGVAYNSFTTVDFVFTNVYEQLSRNMSQPNNDLDQLSNNQLYAISIVNQGYMFLRYTLFWIFPQTNKMSINMMYPFPTSVFSYPQILGFLGYIIWGLTGIYLFTRKNNQINSLAGFVLLFPWLTFGTEFSTVRFHEHIVLYRSYIWMSGFFALLPILLRRIPIKVYAPVLTVVAVIFFNLANQKLHLFSDRLLAWKDAADQIDLSRKNEYTLSIYRNFANTAAYYSVSKQYSKAIEYYKLALDIRPDHAMSTRALGHLYMKTEKLDLAREYLERAAVLDPKYPEAQYNLGIFYAKIKETDKAISHYLKTLELDPKYADAYYNLGNIFTDKKEYSTAIGYYQKCLSLNPLFYDAYYNLGNALFRTNQFEAAAKAYSNASKIKPTYTNAFHNLGLTYVKLNKLDLAKEALLSALKLNPNHKQSKSLLAKLDALQSNIPKTPPSP